MSKSSNKKVKSLLRISGLVFAFAGSFHVLRYFAKVPLVVGDLEITYLGSLVIGIAVLCLSAACFLASRD